MNTQITASPKLFIGIDIHKRSWKIHCSTDLFSGKSFNLAPDTDLLYKYVGKHFSGHEVNVVYEAGCCGYRAHRCFVEYEWRSLVVNPADVHRKGRELHTKTDKIDAQLLSRELKDGRLDSIHIPGMEREQLRSLFRRGNDLVKDYRRIKSYIKMQLLYFGIKEPEELDNDHWSYKYRKWLDDMVFRYPTTKATLESRMRFFRFVARNCAMFPPSSGDIAKCTIRRIICCSEVSRVSLA